MMLQRAGRLHTHFAGRRHQSVQQHPGVLRARAVSQEIFLASSAQAAQSSDSWQAEANRCVFARLPMHMDSYASAVDSE